MKFLSILRLISICWLLIAACAALAEQDTAPLRLGMTPATARNQYALLEEWRVYLTKKLDRPVEFIFRDSYQESLDLMKQKKLDFAWFSAPAYLKNQQQICLLATPLYQGKPYDRAYLIVPSADHDTHSLLDLKDRIFAYVDPASSTGYFEPRDQLRHAQEDPDQFFLKTFFTRDHQKIVAAVSIGLADGGSLSGFAWESLALTRPDITAQTRIVNKSGKLGFPPIIARRSLDKRDFARMQRALLAMSGDATGNKLLKLLNLDGFVVADAKLYRSVSVMMQRSGDL